MNTPRKKKFNFLPEKLYKPYTKDKKVFLQIFVASFTIYGTFCEDFYAKFDNLLYDIFLTIGPTKN